MKMCAEIMDVTRDEAKRILRRLELEAYSSIISAFRAQGDLSRSKKKLLQELGTQLSISTERHRAEVRRAYSDDRLAVVAESIYGPGSCAEWAAEGRRLVPLMPRLVPQTVFSASATAAANTAAAANAKVLSSSGNKAAASSSASNSTVNSSNVSSNGPSSVNHQTVVKATNSKPQPQTGGIQANDADGFDDDGKPKRRRRLSVTSLNKPVTKVTIPTPLVTKPLTKTTSVSTMTKAGKALGPVGTVKTVPRISPLSASASQVKLLTKTVAVTQTVCQAKTVLSYKTLTSVASSPVKVQTVMTQSTPKTQTKVTTATPPKALLTPKTPSSTAVKNVTVPSVNPVVTTSPIPVTLKTTTLTAAQLAGRQRAKQVTTRFKPLPGTVKFKTVTPATMGTGSTVTMVTPSPSTQASSALPVSGTQPVVRVIHVPGTGGVGGSKPVVVMTTGLSKSAVGNVVPGITSGTSLSKATSQVAPSSSAGKAPVTTATTTVQSTKPSTTLAHAVSSAPKTVVMTTLVGSKRVVLSVPAPLPVSSISNPTSSSQGLGITKSQGLPSLASSNASQLHASSKKEIKPSPLTTVCLTPSPSQPTPSHSASTVTTQVRSRPLPALLPAPPKPSIITPSQTTVTPTTTASVRKLPTILPAPAKNMAVIPTVLVPVATGVGPTAAGQLQPSIPLVVAPAVTAVGVPGVCPDGGGEPCPPFTVSASQDCKKISMDLGSLHCEETLVTETPVLDSHAPSEREHKEQSVVESPELSNQTNSKSASQYEQSTVTEGDNNTSSEDDSLLMCSETIDSGCGLADTSSSLEYYQGVSESTPIKSSVSQIEQDLAEMPPSVLGISDRQTEVTPCDTSVPLIDIEVPVSDLQTLEIQKEKANEQEHLPTSAAEPLENVTVERLGDPAVISDVVESSVPDQFASDSLDLAEQVKVCDAELDSALHSAGVNIVHKEDEEQQTVKDESQGLPHPMENALQVIASFVESMEGGPLAKEDQKQTTDILSHEPPSKFQRMESYSSENSDFAKELLDITCEQSNIPHNVNSAANPDSIQDTESSSNALLTCHEENWDVTSDANIDILSTSTSSCGSTPDCLDLTEKEIKALESAASIRTSGRKRKPPSSLEVSPSRQVSGWVRGALSLLQRVGSYRGQGRRKSDYGAATWFLKPVDPVDAPGYYKVIKTPMDFGTIKVKLETGQYQEYSEFHSDMLLVKTNCLKYNPPGHDVRQDCNEVFAFYENEYTKMLERWEKCHVSPAKKPRIAAKVESTT